MEIVQGTGVCLAAGFRQVFLNIILVSFYYTSRYNCMAFSSVKLFKKVFTLHFWCSEA